MNIYKPTWLYIKKHNITGLKYFGKTTSKDPHKYPGSGKYWKLHLREHGNDVSTIWCNLYCDESTLIDESIAFSRSHDIVNSTDWANLKPENGIDGGGCPGRITSDETKKKISNANRGRKMSPEFCKMRSETQSGKVPWNKGKKGVQVSANKGRKFGTPSDEYRKNMSEILKGRPKPPRSAEHAKKISEKKLGKPGHPQTDAAKQKISQKNAGRRKMHNNFLGIFGKMISSDQINNYLLNGWELTRNI